MSKPFRETVKEREQRDPEFKKALEEEVLRNLYQFLHEIVHGMFGDNAECVKNAEELMKEMEGRFATELLPPDNDNSADYGTTDYPDINYLKSNPSRY